MFRNSTQTSSCDGRQVSEGFDIYGWSLIIGVAALFVWYFWHTAKSMISSARRIAEIAEGAADRQRAELDYEAKFGPRPLWYRAAQKLIIAVLIVGTGWLIWDRLLG